MKKVFIALALSFIVLNVKGEFIDSDQAATRVMNAMQKGSHNLRSLKQDTSVKPLTLAHTFKDIQLRPTLYIYNVTGGGIVVAPTDDNIAPVLGYMKDGIFSIEECPDALLYLLEEYSHAIAYATTPQRINDISISHPSSCRRIASVQKAPKKTVEPLLKNIKWNQSTPYNNLCPTYSYQGKSYHCPTGCVATAIGQIMYYHKWPAKGTGSKSYKYLLTDYSGNQTTKTASTTFSSHSYAWNSMLDQYEGSTYTQAQGNAVATLLYDIGVSVEMQYGAQGSGAMSAMIPDALTQYFGYANTVDMLYRSIYTATEWDNILKTELSNDRPLYLSGANDEGGHAFVCDGYNEDGYYHINWGWNGLSNGYFLISSLDPDQQGVGGSYAGYNIALDAIIGIQPPSENMTSQMPTLHYDYIDNTYQYTNIKKHPTENKYVLTFGLTSGARQFDGVIAYEVYDKNNKLVDGGRTGKSFQQAATFKGNSQVEFNIVSDVLLKNGDLKFYLYYQQKGSTEWKTIRTYEGKEFAELIDNTFGLYDLKSLTGLEINNASTTPITGGTGWVNLKIKAMRDYDGAVWGLLYDSKDNYIGSTDYTRVAVAKDETADVELFVPLPEATGTYTLYVAYMLGDNGEFIHDEEGDYCSTTITVRRPTGEEKMDLHISRFTLTPETTYDGIVSFSTTIQNIGTSGTTRLLLVIYDSDNNQKMVFDAHEQEFANGQRRTFSSSLDLSELEYGDYRIYFYCQGDSQENSYFLYPSASFKFSENTAVGIGTSSILSNEASVFTSIDGRRMSIPKHIFIQTDGKHSTKQITR